MDSLLINCALEYCVLPCLDRDCAALEATSRDLTAYIFDSKHDITIHRSRKS